MSPWLGAAAMLVLSACSRGEPAGAAPPVAGIEARARGRALYLAHCALCHGETGDGQGVRRVGLSGPPASFRSPSWRRTATPARVFAAIRGGRPGTSMAAWTYFDDAQTWDLVAYLLALADAP
jgi:high-affinity iron transporter